MKSELMLIAGMLNDTAEICKDIKAALKIKQIQIKLEKLINDEGTNTKSIAAGNDRRHILSGTVSGTGSIHCMGPEANYRADETKG